VLEVYGSHRRYPISNDEFGYITRPPQTAPCASPATAACSGQPKATFYAYRVPLYLPHTTPRRGRPAEVWGSVRPAPFMALDGGDPQTVAIQLQCGGHGPFSTLKTVTLSSPEGYFDVSVAFPASGKVRLAYAFPAATRFCLPHCSAPRSTAGWSRSRALNRSA
jgi:hypothetical protein